MKKYLEFGSLNKVIEWDYMPSAFKYWKWKNFYKAETKFVRFYRDANFKRANPSKLNRETLRYGSYDCKVINDFDVISLNGNDKMKQTHCSVQFIGGVVEREKTIKFGALHIYISV